MKTISLSAQCDRFNSLVKGSQFTGKDGVTFNHDFANKRILDYLYNLKQHSGCVFVVGNGGSATIASHLCTDLINVAAIRATVMHESSAITCFANDYGYENAFSIQLHKIATEQDMLVAISSSGQSQNIINAAMVMRNKNAKVVTLTGFSKNNPLRQLGNINYWVNSSEYGLVEISHLFMLHHLSDQIGAHRMAAHEKILVSGL